eukprot:GEMP01086526.1.p1 GENE.GEMP01086526.1~~GEMP01086526.1.p1  ORF type:complete len:212 (-),score=30.46 GEMP01086526.1:206-841(-)
MDSLRCCQSATVANDCIRVHITGFGPFGGVRENPSSIICDRLAGLEIPNVEVVSSRTLEVSAGAVDAFLNEDCDIQEGDMVIHIGVAQGSSKILLEGRAVNEAYFDIPDARGEKRNGHIVEDEPRCVYTTLPIPQLVCVIRDHDIPVELSTDAGRYVCNYLYFQSLRHSATKKILFVHVPDFTVLGEEVQVCALKLILEELSRLYVHISTA